MSIFKSLLGVAGAAALLTATTASAAATPSSAGANPAASLSLGSVRADGQSAHSSRLGAAVPTGTLISIGILAALVVIVLVATKNNNSDSN